LDRDWEEVSERQRLREREMGLTGETRPIESTTTVSHVLDEEAKNEKWWLLILQMGVRIESVDMYLFIVLSSPNWG